MSAGLSTDEQYSMLGGLVSDSSAPARLCADTTQSQRTPPMNLVQPGGTRVWGCRRNEADQEYTSRKGILECI
jgi:hypothetical protein